MPSGGTATHGVQPREQLIGHASLARSYTGSYNITKAGKYLLSVKETLSNSWLTRDVRVRVSPGATASTTLQVKRSVCEITLFGIHTTFPVGAKSNVVRVRALSR